MARIANKPIVLVKGVQVEVQSDNVTVKGPKGTLTLAKPDGVQIKIEDGHAMLSADEPKHIALAGTLRSIIDNMVLGVTEGFERKLELVGVGYRAAMKGKDLSLQLGFSHPIVYVAPEGISISTPTQTEVLVQGADNQRVGQVAAKIRGFRPPEPYKGKGVKYAGETIIRKEAKKA